ncbi:MAG TPA: choice-of-anchor J domain-containing protein, partial [Chloroflexia bacterium]|nr:choice-of-anchor J domain-containing protein [Chloroflexia bacterium]
MFKMSSSPGAPRTQPQRRSTRLISILSLLLLPAFLLLLRETSLQAEVTHAAGLGSVPAQADRFGQKDGRKEAPPSVEQPGGRNSQVPQGACSQTQIDEGFDDITTLSASGWFTQNNSSPQGVTGWFQGNPEAFPAHSGATNSYVGANFNNTTGSNTISNWLLSPQVSLQNGDMFVFWTRTSEDNPLPDRLEVRLSTAGASTNVGNTSTSVGDFTVLL